MIRFTDNASARLRRLASAPMLPALGEVLQAGAQAIVADAQHSIHDGAVSGAGHVPSKPGEAPNNDTGELADSIHSTEAVEIGDYVQAAVVVDAPYGLALELGTSRMAERPFLRPATARQRAGIHEALVARKRQVEAEQP